MADVNDLRKELRAKLAALDAYKTLKPEERTEATRKKMQADMKRAADLEVEIRDLEGIDALGRRNPPVSNGEPPGFGYSTEERKVYTGKHALGMQFRDIAIAGAPSGQVSERLAEFRATGLGEGIASDGGFLLQQDFSTQLLTSRNAVGKVAQFCKKIVVTTGNSISLPVIDETNRTTGNRWGGVRSYWGSEAALLNASAPKIGKLLLEPKKHYVLVYASDELLEDVSVLSQFISEAATEELGFTLDDAIIRGTGAGQPLGIINAGCTVTASAENGQAAATIVYENIVKMWARLWPIGQATAVWLVHPSALTQLYTMSLAVGTGGAPVFMPGGSVSETPFATLFGRPLIACEQCSALGTAGDIILADLTNGYLIAERGTMRGDVSMHVRFLYDESVFRFIRRIDGQPIISTAITPYKGSDSLSPFVTLATRA